MDRGFGHVHRAIAGANGGEFYAVYFLPPGSETHVIGPLPAPEECIEVKATRVNLRVGTGDRAVECQFRYRRSQQAWLMFLRDGARWVVTEPRGVSAGELLEKIMLVLLGEDPQILRTRAPQP